MTIQCCSRFTVLSASLMLLSGCGLVTVDTPAVPVNMPIPTEFLSNDVEKPEVGRYTMATLCGHLAERLPNGKFRPLNIPAYPAGNAPTLVAASDKVPNDYYSLIDNSGSAALAAAYGPGTGSFNTSGQDRLETTIRPVATCQAKHAGRAVIEAAVAELVSFQISRDSIYIINTATQEELVVNRLQWVSSDSKAAVTPILNIGGTIYTKQQEVGRKDFIAVYATQVNAVLRAPVGSQVSASPGSAQTDQLAAAVGTRPSAAEIAALARAVSGSLSMVRADGQVGAGGVAILPQDEFLIARRANSRDQSIEVGK